MIKRPTDPNPLFSFSEETIITHDSDIVRQRQRDGSPITKGNLTALKPPTRQLTIKDMPIKKSVEATRTDEENKLDPDEVVKAWLMR